MAALNCVRLVIGSRCDTRLYSKAHVPFYPAQIWTARGPVTHEIGAHALKNVDCCAANVGFGIVLMPGSLCGPHLAACQYPGGFRNRVVAHHSLVLFCTHKPVWLLGLGIFVAGNNSTCACCKHQPAPAKIAGPSVHVCLPLGPTLYGNTRLTTGKFPATLPGCLAACVRAAVNVGKCRQM